MLNLHVKSMVFFHSMGFSLSFSFKEQFSVKIKDLLYNAIFFLFN